MSILALYLLGKYSDIKVNLKGKKKPAHEKRANDLCKTIIADPCMIALQFNYNRSWRSPIKDHLTTHLHPIHVSCSFHSPGKQVNNKTSATTSSYTFNGGPPC